MRPRALILASALVGGLTTLLVTVFPFVDLAYRSPSLHVVLETATTLSALITAYLVYGRFRQSGQARDLALVAALVILALKNLLFAATFSTLGIGATAAWASIAGAFVGACVYACAAFGPERRVSDRRQATTTALLASVLSLSAITLAVILLSSKLPSVGIPPALGPEAAGHPRIVGHPVMLIAQLVTMVCFFAAALGFARRGERTNDELMGWLAAGSVLGAFARLNYFLFPSLYSEWFFTGDLLRIGSYFVFLIGASREISRYWHSVADAAVLDERRRVARDLHDGVAQELAFITTQARSLAAAGGSHALTQLATAAERALDDSRRAIAALTRPVDEPLGLALAQAAEEVAGRAGARVRLELAEGIHVDPPTREALLRIAREAVANAARHGRADVVTLELSNGDGLRLRIADDGTGFDPAAGGRGFGIVGMRERVQALGGSFTLASKPGSGTEVEVVLP